VHPYIRPRKKKSNRRRPEQALQHTVGRYLDVALPPDAMWAHYPAGGFRKPVEAKIFRSLGVRAGIPDILVFHCGRVYGIELKAPDRRGLTEAQRAMHARLEQCGVLCAVVTAVEEVEDFLSPHIPLRAHLGDRDRSGASDRNAEGAADAENRN
jgi:hypothetical protein